MTAEERRAQRKHLNVLHGEERFDDARTQRELGFNKSGATIVDKLLVPPLEYDLRSRAGRALFYEGAFVTGDIALAAGLLAQNPAPIVIEAEAGVGAQAVALGLALGRGRIVAFEPEKETRSYFERNVSRAKLDKRIEVVPRALGSEAGYDSFGGDPVEVVTLDAYVRAEKLDHLALVRIAAPGRESAIVAGAKATLAALRPVLLLSLSAESSESAAERTIADIVTAGYRPYVSLEGYAIPYSRYRPALRNYLFVDERSDLRPELSADPEHLLGAAAALIALTENQAQRIAALEGAGSEAGDVVSGALVEGLRAANLQMEEALRQRDADIAMLVDGATFDPAELESLRTISAERAQALELLEEALRRLPG